MYYVLNIVLSALHQFIHLILTATIIVLHFTHEKNLKVKWLDKVTYTASFSISPSFFTFLPSFLSPIPSYLLAFLPPFLPCLTSFFPFFLFLALKSLMWNYLLITSNLRPKIILSKLDFISGSFTMFYSPCRMQHNMHICTNMIFLAFWEFMF